MTILATLFGVECVTQAAIPKQSSNDLGIMMEDLQVIDRIWGFPF